MKNNDKIYTRQAVDEAEVVPCVGCLAPVGGQCFDSFGPSHHAWVHVDRLDAARGDEPVVGDDDAKLKAAMLRGDIDTVRSLERERTSVMREAARSEAFKQGWMRGKFTVLAGRSDQELLDALPAAEIAYKAFCKERDR